MASTLLTNLVAYYKLDSNANDVLGTYNLTVSGATSQPSSGKLGGDYRFVMGSSQKISVGSNLGINGGLAFSMSCWIKPNTTPGGGQNIMSLSTTSGNNFFAMWYDATTWGGGTGLLFTRNRDQVGTDQQKYVTTLSNGTWYHVALTYDGSTVKGYLNGVEVVSFGSSGSGSGSDKGNIFALGNYHIWYWDGDLDEAGVWNKKLSVAEIGELYNAGTGKTYPFASASIPKILMF